MRAAASSFLVLATAATAVTAFNATSQYEFTMKVINHTDDRSWEDSVYRLNVGVDQHTNETGSWATEKLWLQTPEGINALAFRTTHISSFLRSSKMDQLAER